MDFLEVGGGVLQLYLEGLETTLLPGRLGGDEGRETIVAAFVELCLVSDLDCGVDIVFVRHL